MEAITFSPAQVHMFNLVSHINSAMGLERLREQLSAFYAKQVDDEMNQLWESGQFDGKRLQELRGSHFRTLNLVTLDEFMKTRIVNIITV